MEKDNINLSVIDYLENKIKVVSEEEDNACYFKQSRYPYKQITYDFRSAPLTMVKNNIKDNDYENALTSIKKAMAIGFLELNIVHIWISYLQNSKNITIKIKGDRGKQQDISENFDSNGLKGNIDKESTLHLSDGECTDNIDISELDTSNLKNTSDLIHAFLSKRLIDKKLS